MTSHTTRLLQPGLEDIGALIDAGLIDGSTLMTVDQRDGYWHRPGCSHRHDGENLELAHIAAQRVADRLTGSSHLASCLSGPRFLTPGEDLVSGMPQAAFETEYLHLLRWLTSSRTEVASACRLLDKGLPAEANAGWEVADLVAKIRFRLLRPPVPLGSSPALDDTAAAMEVRLRTLEADLRVLGAYGAYRDRELLEARNRTEDIIGVYDSYDGKSGLTGRELRVATVLDGVDLDATQVWVAHGPQESVLALAEDWVLHDGPRGMELLVRTPAALVVPAQSYTPGWVLCVDEGYSVDTMVAAATLETDIFPRGVGDYAAAIMAANTCVPA